MSKNCEILILGDICPRWGNGEQFNTGSPEAVFHDLLPLMQSADMVVANLEAPATEETSKLPKNSINLKLKPCDIELLAKAGIRTVALANNHILDYGSRGLKDTIKALKKNGVFYYGLSDISNRTVPLIQEVNGYKIGMLAFAEREFNCAVDYSVGAVQWDDIDSIKVIYQAKRVCDCLIVQYHGGVEDYKYPSPMLQKRCRAIAEAGANLIVCQHSHCIGTRENWNGCEILYGQGNSVFGYNPKNSSWNEGVIIRLQFAEKTSVEYIPIEALRDGVHLMRENKKKELLQEIENASTRIKNKDFVNMKWIEFCREKRDLYLPMLFLRGRIFNKLNRITKGKLLGSVTSFKARRNAMNLIRCDAHREVIQTILQQEYYYKV